MSLYGNRLELFGTEQCVHQLNAFQVTQRVDDSIPVGVFGVDGTSTCGVGRDGVRIPGQRSRVRARLQVPLELAV